MIISKKVILLLPIIILTFLYISTNKILDFGVAAASIVFYSYLLLYSIKRDSDRKTIPEGMLLGFPLFMFLLSAFGLLFKGGFLISLSFLTLLYTSTFTAIKTNSLRNALGLLQKNVILAIPLFFAYILLVNGSMINPVPGDVYMHFAIAESFKYGNNIPMKTPWQPSFSLDYRFGEYITEGALSYLSSITSSAVHTLFPPLLFALITIYLLCWRKFSESIILVLVGLIGFGSISLMLPNFIIDFVPHLNAESGIYNARSNDLFRNTSFIHFPSVEYGILYTALGSGPSSPIDSLSLSHNIMAIGIILLFISFLFSEFKYKNILLFILGSTLYITYEAFFAVFMLTLFTLSLISKRIMIKPQTFIAIGIFSLTQGGLLTNMLISNGLNLVFGLHNPEYVKLISNFVKFSLPQNNYFSFLQLPPLLLSLFLTAFFIFIKKNYIGLIFSLAAIISLGPFLYVTTPYWCCAYMKFFTLSYWALGFATAMFIIEVLKEKGTYTKIVVLLFISPFFLYNLSNTIAQSTTYIEKQLILDAPQDPLFIEFIDKLDRKNSIVALSEDVNSAQNLNLYLMIYGGFLVPDAPQSVRSYHIELGPEIIDLINTLNPSIISKLNISYVIIDDILLEKLPIERRAELNSSEYFEFIGGGGAMYWNRRLYRIKQEFLDTGINYNNTLTALNEIISKNSSVYVETEVPKDPNKEGNMRIERNAILLALHEHNLYWGIEWNNESMNRPLDDKYISVNTIINRTKLLPDERREFDYLIIFNDKTPEEVQFLDYSQDDKYEIVWSNSNFNAWKRIKG